MFGPTAARSRAGRRPPAIVENLFPEHIAEDRSGVWTGELQGVNPFILIANTLYANCIGFAQYPRRVGHLLGRLQGNAAGAVGIELGVGFSDHAPDETNIRMTLVGFTTAVDDLTAGATKNFKNTNFLNLHLPPQRWYYGLIRSSYGVTQPTLLWNIGDHAIGWGLSLAGAASMAATGVGGSWANMVPAVYGAFTGGGNQSVPVIEAVAW